MTDKQQMKRDIMDIGEQGSYDTAEFLGLAEDLYNAGYRKVPKNAVVLTREKYDELIEELTNTQAVLMETDLQRINARKETAKDFIFKVESYLGYNADNETFTKKELLLILAEVAKEQFGVEVEDV